MWGGNRPEKCLLSFRPRRRSKTLPLPSGRGKNLSISGGLFWPQHPAPTLDPPNENIPKYLEKKGHNLFSLFGRHSSNREQFRICKNKSSIHGSILRGCWDANKLGQKCPHPLSRSSSLGVFNKFQVWHTAGSKRENKVSKKGVRKISNTPQNVLQKGGFHFRSHKILSAGHALLKGIYRPNVFIFENSSNQRLGLLFPCPPGNARASKTGQGPFKQLARVPLSGKSSCKNPPLRLLPTWLGRNRHQNRQHSTRILEGSRGATYKCKGAASCNSYSEKSGKTWGSGTPVCRQQCDLLLSQEGGKDPT